MVDEYTTYVNATIFDGQTLTPDQSVTCNGGTVVAIGPVPEVPKQGRLIDLGGDILCPKFVDLQVNGGGGVLLNDDPSVDVLRKISDAHVALGVGAFLPTLITDTAAKTRAAIAAVRDAIAADTSGIKGLHLEGPHLSVARKGAHDPQFIRPMENQDLDMLLQAAADIPLLKVTIAPENVTTEQVEELSKAGVLVSLGHTDADYDTCMRYFDAGARCATHLFNAMSQLGSRTPGLVGAVLDSGSVSAGLIADGVHVHPATIKAAWKSKTKPGQIFLVSDAMAIAGTDQIEFALGGRSIRREDGKLVLADGTLAGADLSLSQAIKVMVEDVGIPLEQALAAATVVPAELIGLELSTLKKGSDLAGDFLRLASDLSGTVSLS